MGGAARDGVAFVMLSTRRTLVALTLVAVAVACMTLLWFGMRAVMDVGGVCASGNTAFEIRQECPQSAAAAVPIGIVLGAFAVLAYAFVAAGAHGWMALLAWPILFLSLGWNFLEKGIDGPGDTGLVWGWLLCGVMFVAMGAAPLWFARGGGSPVRTQPKERIDPALMKRYRAELAELDTLRRSGVLTQEDYLTRRMKFPASAHQPAGMGRGLKLAHVGFALVGVAIGIGVWSLLAG